MPDFRLSEEAWAAACRELRAAGPDPNDDDWILLELYCGLYIPSIHPRPAEYAKAWRSVKKAADDLLAAIERLRDVGAAEFQFIGFFPDGQDVAIVREGLPYLSEIAEVVANMEALRPRVPSKADPNRDRLAGLLIDFWTSRGGSTGTTMNGPAMRFLEATFSEAMRAAKEKVPTPAALRKLLRNHHKVPHKGDMRMFADPGNLQSLCAACHSGVKQSMERRGQAEPPGYSRGVGPDGWPLDPRHPLYEPV